MGNDASCLTVGIGNIRITMFDDIFRILCNVKHVPDLRKNLISLDTLNAEGFNYKFESREMKVRKRCYDSDEGTKVGRKYLQAVENYICR